MKLLSIFSLLLLLGSVVTFANDFNERDTEFDNEKKSFLASSARSTGVLPVNTHNLLEESIGSISLSDVATYRSVSPLKEVNVTRTRYTFLQVTLRDAVNGNTTIFTEVIAVDQPVVVAENAPVMVKREELLAQFQDALLVKYPNNMLYVGLENIQQLYDSYEAAQNAKEIAESEVAEFGQVDVIQLR